MNKKFLRKNIIISSLIIPLIGCVPNKKRNELDANIVANTKLDMNVSKTINNIAVNIKLEENIKLPLKIFVLERYNFDNSLLEGALNKKFKQISERNVNERVYQSDNGDIINVFPGTLVYMTNDIKNQDYFYLKNKAQENMKEGVLNLISKEKAIEESNKFIEKLNIKVNTPEVFVFSKENIRSVMDLSETSPKGKKVIDEANIKEFYLIKYKLFNNNGIPYIDGNISGNHGSNIDVLFNEDGIIGIHAKSIYSDKNELKTIEKMVSADKIVDSFISELSKIKSNNKLEINNISLYISPKESESGIFEDLVWIMKTVEEERNPKNNEINKVEKIYKYSAEKGTIINQ